MTGGIYYSYEVIEHYEGEDAPEPFGFVTLRKVPAINDIILLRWLDGKPAYTVQVDRIAGNELHVTAFSHCTCGLHAPELHGPNGCRYCRDCSWDGKKLTAREKKRAAEREQEKAAKNE